jgi:uncharacterized protein involved in exopolysaccharide biosynthesis
MNSPLSTQPLPPEDIDLLALAERILAFFQRFRWLLLLGVAAGLLGGFLTYKKLPKVYQSRMILHSFTLSNEDYIQVIDNYNRLLKRHEVDALATTFGISKSTINRVKEIKANQIQKVFTPSNPNGFYVDVYVTDNAILPELQKGIINGLENIDYIKRQLDIKRENFHLLITDVEREIGRLDSTKMDVERSLRGIGNHTSSIMVDITGLNKQLIEMNEKLLNYKQELQFLSAVQVLQGFSAFSLPAGPKLVVWLGLGFIGGLAISYCIALYISLHEKLIKRKRLRISEGA